MPARLGLEELLQHQQCQGDAFPSRRMLGEEAFPAGDTAKPSAGGENPPDYPDQPTISSPDIQMGTETPGEPGTCLPH